MTKKEEPTTTTPPTDQTAATTANPSSCLAAVEAYKAKLPAPTADAKTVKKSDNIVVHYIWRLKDGTLFDTSVGEVAQACGKFQQGRNYNEGLAFQAGAGQMIAGFDKAVIGMKVWEEKTVTIPAAEAYGVRDEKNVIAVPKAQMKDADKFKEGTELAGPMGQKVKVSKVTSDTVYIDTNHELAGKDLIFDIIIQAIK